MVLLSLAMAQANGSLVLATEDDERTGMMGISAEDDRLALSRPGALEIGNPVLCLRGGDCGIEERQCEDQTLHCFPPVMKWIVIEFVFES